MAALTGTAFLISFLISLCVDALIGAIAGKIMGSHRGFFGNALIGIGGGIIGNIIAMLTKGDSGFILSIIGACILTLLLGRGK